MNEDNNGNIIIVAKTDQAWLKQTGETFQTYWYIPIHGTRPEKIIGLLCNVDDHEGPDGKKKPVSEILKPDNN